MIRVPVRIQVWFAAALPLSEALRREWITAAQVFCYHCC